MSSHLQIICLSLFSIAIGPHLSTPVLAEIQLATVLDAWQERDKATQTAKFVWTRSSDSISRFGGNRPAWNDVEGETQSNVGTSVLRFDAQRLRFDSYRWLYSPQLLLNSNASNVFDIALLKKFDDSNVGRQPTWHFNRYVQAAERKDRYSSAKSPLIRWEITSANGSHAKQSPLQMHAGLEQSTDFDSLEYTPILLHYRVLSSSEIGFRSDAAQLVETTARYNGRPSLELVEDVQSPDATLVRRYWVDPSRDYAICRYVGERNGKAAVQVDMNYKEDHQFGWLPSSWTIQVFHDHYDRWPLLQKSRVTDFEINPKLSPAVLEPVIGPNSIVFDRIDNRINHISLNGASQTIRANEIHQFAAQEATPSNVSTNKVAVVITVVGLIVAALSIRWWLAQSRHRRSI